jgi:hypothetical protein
MAPTIKHRIHDDSRRIRPFPVDREPKPEHPKETATELFHCFSRTPADEDRTRAQPRAPAPVRPSLFGWSELCDIAFRKKKRVAVRPDASRGAAALVIAANATNF